jgi:hypothetical protein
MELHPDLVKEDFRDKLVSDLSGLSQEQVFRVRTFDEIVDGAIEEAEQQRERKLYKQVSQKFNAVNG